ncbi:DUF302 domain-containing protein [Nocardia sp. CA-128927]|uniref:DUF302 domain-containing protein n=1 Tax=Nocardia sp. CA-128927 TaxID=3239975 RepID=UPI003D97936E
MNYHILVDHSAAQTVLELHRNVYPDDAGDDIRNGMQALYDLGATTGFVPSGPPTTTYLGRFGSGISTEVQFELPMTAGPLDDPDEQAGLRHNDPFLFAHTTHRGGYHQIGEAYRALYAWLDTSMFQQAGPPTEVYLVAPSEVLDPAELLTEIRIPIVPAELAVRVAAPFDRTVSIVRNALTEQGFGVLTEIDVRATLRAKLGCEMEDYLILGACNPALAREALDIDRQVGLLMPCNVVIRADADSVVVEAADPDRMLGADDRPELRPIAQDARTRLAAVLLAVAQATAASR